MPKTNYAHNMQFCEGSLIVGSSNLTHNGLEKNYEVNLLTKESADINYALEEFDRLWEKSVEITKDDIDECVKQSYLKILSPKDIYYKLLLTHFGKDCLYKDSSIEAIFKNYKAYDYQIHAVQEGIAKLKRYNGFFLSDVVGLGKTLIATIIAQKCRMDRIITGKILVIAPPSVKTSWKKHFDDIGITNYDTSTHDSLRKIPEETREDIELIIIDESHNFRSSTSKRYKELESICKFPFNGAQKKIILLSATPQNNSPKDLANQVYLFRNRRNSGIEGLSNLENFFANLEKEFKEIIQELKKINQNTNQSAQEKESTQDLKKKLENIANTLRDKLLSHIMIRRTRGDIELLYKDDMKKQNLTFPKIEPPKDLLYDLDSNSHNLAKETIAFLSKQNNNIGTFSYVRYLIFPYLTQDGQNHFLQQYEENEDKKSFYNDTAERLSGLIQKILFKRFDSSIAAFKATLKNQIKSHNALIAMFEKDNIAIPKRYDSREDLYEAALSDNDEDLVNFLDKKEDKFISLKKHHFKSDFYPKLKDDKDALQKLFDKWKEIQEDPKLDRLKNFLDTEKSHKIVLFTEAMISAKYLAKELKDYRILQIDAKNREENEQKIKENFDANYPKKQEDDFNIIIATDALAEGINLHCADIIINYDTPYNATRLMQRIGRINRIGTSFEKIYIYNFKPTHLADEIIQINAIASSKLQSFHYTLGEDSAIYDDEEIVGSRELYSKINDENKEISKDTKYIKALQDFYRNHKDEFDKIEHLPLKSRSIIESDKSQSFAYIRHISNKIHHAHFYPYHITPSQDIFQNPNPQECDFYEMADFLEKHLESKPSKKADISVHYEHIQSAINTYKESLKSQNMNNLTKKELSSKENNAIHKINSCQELDTQSKKLFKELIQNGHPLAKEIIAIKAKDSVDFKIQILALKQKYALDLQAQPHTEQTDSTYQEPQIQISITAIRTI